MAVELGNERVMVELARERCGELVGRLREGTRELERPCRWVGDDALAEGRAAYDRAAAAAEALLAALDRPTVIEGSNET